MSHRQSHSKRSYTRREFIQASAGAGLALMAFPMILPSRVFGADAPSKKLNIGVIGCGRIGMSMDVPGLLKQDIARVVALADLDSKRVAHAKQSVEQYYAKKLKNEAAVVVKTYGDYHEMLQDPAIDAVAICTPDHWHAQPAMEVVLAGKDVYCQKPCSLTIAEGRAMSDVIQKSGRIFQMGSQQRSGEQFRLACELVRNGRIGKLHTVQIGLPADVAGKPEAEMPVPPNLNYDMWLGSTPFVYYTENRVHPQNSITARPGWLRCDQFTAGMITGWGSHHVDIAHWGMDTEHTGPIEVQAKTEFLSGGLWDVHGDFTAELKYANGVTMLMGSKFANGVRFEGSDGWIFVTRGNAAVTASDPVSTKGKKHSAPLQASKPEILTTPIGENEIHLHVSPKGDHHADWLNAIVTRKPAVTTIEVSHRSCSACLATYVAMRTGRKLQWDPQTEKFVNDDEANKWVQRPQRPGYGTHVVLEKIKA